MLDSQFIKSLTDLRNDPKSISELAKKADNPVYILDRGKPVSVLMDVKAYEEMVEKLDDVMDALEMKNFEKKNIKKDKWISLEDLKKKHNLT